MGEALPLVRNLIAGSIPLYVRVLSARPFQTPTVPVFSYQTLFDGRRNSGPDLKLSCDQIMSMSSLRVLYALGLPVLWLSVFQGW